MRRALSGELYSNYVAICLLWLGFSSIALSAHAQAAAQTPSAARAMGTIKTISGNTLTLATETGEMSIQVQDQTRFLQVAPGQTDLKNAATIQLSDLKPGDRILVRGKPGDDGKSIAASSVIAMKQADIAQKQSRDREEWQKHGFGGLVSSADSANRTVVVALPSLTEKKSVTVHLSQNAIARRYAPDSVKFDEAKPAPLDQIKPGDQLRARGTRNADGSEFTADEVVSGTFRNLSGPISALDTTASTITVQDLVLKKPVTVKITSESQLKKLPPPMAQRIAARLKGTTPDAQGGQQSPGSATSANASAPQSPQPNGPGSGGTTPGGPGGAGRFAGGGGSADLQQMIARMPAVTLADLQKGDAVMIVATEGTLNTAPTVVTLLGGVEPILEASPKNSTSTILSPWSLSTGGGGEAATP